MITTGIGKEGTHAYEISQDLKLICSMAIYQKNIMEQTTGLVKLLDKEKHNLYGSIRRL